MNRTDRLLALVLELQGRGWVRAEDLARSFEVSVRTVYRDVLALNEAGVPVVSVPGRGYRLMEGYFLPPLHFTPQEAVMLALGADAVRETFDAEYAGAAVQALKKLLAALPEDRRTDVEHLRAHLRVVRLAGEPDAAVLRTLRGAVLGRRTVTFRYHRPGAEPGERRVNPYGLVSLNGAWLLVAFDHARAERRTFRLDRIGELHLTPQTFNPDPTFRLERQPEREERGLRVRVRFTPEQARWVRERPNFFQVAAHEGPQGYDVTLAARGVQDVLAWVLSWGSLATVLDPPELRERVRQEARALLEHS